MAVKKTLLIIFTFSFLELINANEAYYYYASGGNIIPSENTNVQMVEEIINIELFDKFYKINVDFTFYNHGETEKLLVGFPYFYASNAYEGSGGIYDFKTFVNEKLVEHSNTPIDIMMEYDPTWKRDGNDINMNYAFTKEVEFIKGQITTTKVEYNVKYGGTKPFRTVNYFYGSGKNWNKEIGKMTIIINYTDNWIYTIFMRDIDIAKNMKIDDNKIEINLENIEPDEKDRIIISTGSPMFDLSIGMSLPDDFVYSREIIKKNDLSFFSKSNLRTLRNLFYALYGYDFKDERLRNYFSQKSWYKINPDFNENMFSEIEKTNIQIILEEERKRINNWNEPL
jgi:hypothetical protein